MSTLMISLLAVVVAVAALAVIVLGDRRQPATNSGRRAAAKVENAPSSPTVPDSERHGRQVRAVAGIPYRRPRWYRRLGATLGIGITAIIVGALVAIGLAIAIVTGLLVLRQAVG